MDVIVVGSRFKRGFRACAEVAEAMARTAELYGLNRSYGKVYGYLYLSGERKSLDELAEESGYAKSTVSNAMTALERYHFVHRRSSPGEGRKLYFEAEIDYWRILEEFLEQQGRHEIRILKRGLESANQALEDVPETEQTRRAKERIAKLQRLVERSEQAIDFITTVSIDQILSIVEAYREQKKDDEI